MRHAVYEGHQQIVGLMLDGEKCAPLVTMTNSEGKTPLQLAELPPAWTEVAAICSIRKL